MTAQVHHLRLAEVGDPAKACNRILKSAKGKLQDVIIIGWDTNGDLWTDCSIVSGPDALWLLEQAKKELLDGA